MDINKYQELASRTLPELGSKQANDLHMIMGMQTEIGELTDIHKREFAYKKPLDKIHQTEEVGDILWYLANYCKINDISIEDAMDKNIRKLQARFPEKFTEHDALNRDLDAERKELEK